ncbi:alpha/beta hydrolase family protein [Streptomyces sp. NPDC002519]
MTNVHEGVRHARLDPQGRLAWWFSHPGDELGVWRAVDYETGQPATTGCEAIEAGRDGGMALTDEAVVVALIRGRTTTIYRVDKSHTWHVIRHRDHLARLSPGAVGDRFCLTEFADDGTVAGLEVLDGAGQTLARLAAGGEAACLAWRPGTGQLLVRTRRDERDELSLWDPDTDDRLVLPVRLRGDLAASWYPSGSHLLIRATDEGQSLLSKYSVQTGECVPIGPQTGTIDTAAVRPDGTVWYRWSSASTPPQISTDDGRTLLQSRESGRGAVDGLERLSVETPHGDVPVLFLRPEGAPPFATVFLLHGGPALHDRDEWNPVAASFLSAGWAVAQINYRGSTGFGQHWLDAALHDPGHAELADIAEVRLELIKSGRADAARLVVCGSSWGGYLALLALGVQPDAWSGGIAEAPIADYATAYEEELEAAKAFDRYLFGGSPSEVPDRYHRASPLSYASLVQAPVLVIAGRNDPGCTVRQVHNYVGALRSRDHSVEYHECDMGHGTPVIAEKIEHQALILSFLSRWVD